MSFLVLAFPTIPVIDFNRIQLYRQKNDLHYDLVDPHFTLVFPLDDLTETAVVNEIETISKRQNQINFLLGTASVHKDEFSDNYFEFLVPTKGFAEIVSLHDRLYGNLLQPFWRKDIEYIPHITIGRSMDQKISQDRVGKIHDISIPGKIEALTILKFQNNILSKVKDIYLNVAD